MPFFHDQNRSSLRRSYVEAWRKRREALPLEPLEHQIADVVELHPEYHPVLEGDADALQRDYSPEGGQSNPFLHMGLHLAIREQVSTNRPAGIAAVHAALCARLGSAHEAEHRMIECLGEALWRAQRSGLPPDEAAYLESLRRIAGAT
ncbi:MAG: DUF1841 family protein [Steroidobacteraceae bacterium]